MRTLITLALGLVVFVVVAPSRTDAQNLIRVTLQNRSHQEVYVFVYDRLCGYKAFEGRLGQQASSIISICPDDRGRGHIVIHDPRGRSQRIDNLRASSTVPVRFR